VIASPGAGCNVPAILGTRVLGTMRERIIASTLVVLTPASARTAVILGAVSATAGWKTAVGIYGVTAVITLLTGVGLHHCLPGRSTGLVMEMFPFRHPGLGPILQKTWYRFRDFVVATPIIDHSGPAGLRPAGVPHLTLVAGAYTGDPHPAERGASVGNCETGSLRMLE